MALVLNFNPWKNNLEFEVQLTVHRDKFLQLNQLNALISQIYFWNKTLHVSDSSSVHHQEFFTVHTAMVYVIQVCWQLSSRIRMELKSTCFGQFLCPSSGVFHCTHSNGICHKGLLTACEPCLQAVSKPVWHVPLQCVRWKTPDDGQRNCPKHEEYYSKNKFEKLVHLVGFIIRITWNIWSSEIRIFSKFSI